MTDPKQPPAYEDIQPTDADITLSVVHTLTSILIDRQPCTPDFINPTEALTATNNYLAHLKAAYQAAQHPDRAFQADYMLPYYIHEIELFKKVRIILAQQLDDEPKEISLEECYEPTVTLSLTQAKELLDLLDQLWHVM